MSRTGWADVVVVGGGCIGLSVATALRRAMPGSRIVLLEKDPSCGLHASGRNSGVLHAGFYYSSETMKAKMTREGNRALTEFIQDRGLQLNRCGKLVVARSRVELAQLRQLHARGRANGVELDLITAAEAHEIDPLARTVELALWSPSTSVADPEQVSQAQVKEAAEAGVQIRVGQRLLDVSRTPSGLRLITSTSETTETRHLVNAAGLYADRVAYLCNVGLQYTVVPFRGLFLRCSSPQIRTNIYPVPDLRQPFLGVHWTVAARAGAQPKIGPTSMPALGREHYAGIPARGELAPILYQLARMLWHDRDGLRGLAWRELARWGKGGICAAAADLVSVPVSPASTTWLEPGVRAQLVRRSDAGFVHDFIVDGDDRSTHVLNAVSPAWTCAIPIADHVVNEHVVRKLDAVTP